MNDAIDVGTCLGWNQACACKAAHTRTVLVALSRDKGVYFMWNGTHLVTCDNQNVYMLYSYRQLNNGIKRQNNNMTLNNTQSEPVPADKVVQHRGRARPNCTLTGSTHSYCWAKVLINNPSTVVEARLVDYPVNQHTMLSICTNVVRPFLTPLLMCQLTKASNTQAAPGNCVSAIVWNSQALHPYLPQHHEPVAASQCTWPTNQ